MGVLVLTVAILPSDKKSSSLQLMRAECPGPNVEKLVPKGKSSALILYVIYAVLTLVMIMFLVFGGMPLYDSVCTTFATAGTGGFGIKNAGLGFYNSAYIEGVVTVFMIMFGVNFNIYYFIAMRRFAGVFRNSELKLYLGTIFVSIGLIIANTMAYGVYDNFSKAFRYSSFQVGSIMTSTGFATADFDAWPEFSKVILILLMFIGACAGSTGGGFKVSRVLMSQVGRPSTSFSSYSAARAVSRYCSTPTPAGRPISTPSTDSHRFWLMSSRPMARSLKPTTFSVAISRYRST